MYSLCLIHIISFYYDPKNPTPFRQTSNATFEDEDGEVDNDGNIITRREYPNGYGTGQGKAGVYLAFQINNEIGTDGIPVFYPIITTFDANQEINKDNIEARNTLYGSFRIKSTRS